MDAVVKAGDLGGWKMCEPREGCAVLLGYDDGNEDSCGRVMSECLLTSCYGDRGVEVSFAVVVCRAILIHMAALHM